MSTIKLGANPNMVIDNLVQQVAELTKQVAVSMAIVEQQAQEIEELKSQVENGEADEN